MGKSQRADLRAGLRLAANAAAERFRESFLALPPPLQRNLAPYLEVPFLRRVVQTLANDERGDFAQWAGNPRILEVLAATKEALHTGRLTEVEAERLLLAQAKVGAQAGWLLARSPLRRTLPSTRRRSCSRSAPGWWPRWTRARWWAR